MKAGSITHTHTRTHSFTDPLIHMSFIFHSYAVHMPFICTQVLVPTDPKSENTFVLSSLPGQKSVRDRSFRAETRPEMTQWLRVLVSASLVAQ